MNYTQKQIGRFNGRTNRFTEILAITPVPMGILAEEGALIIEAMVAIAGPDVLAYYTRSALRHSDELAGLCPWDHADDRSLHPIVAHGMCAECRAATPAE